MSTLDAPDSLDALAGVLDALRATRARLEKRRRLVDYLRALPDGSLPLAVTYLGGRPFPRGDGRTLSVGGATLTAALRAARPELTDDAIAAAWRRHADAGDTAAELWAGVAPGDPTPLRLADVAAAFAALAAARGSRAKTALLADVFRRMGDRAIRAFVKAMLGEARIGAQEQTLEDAVAHATGQPIEAVRAANRHRADLGAVAVDARHGRLEPARVTYFTPVDPMLAQPVLDAADAVRRLGTPLWVEDKYDGVRCQLHKVEAEVRLFSRDRRDLTAQFPEVVAAFAATAGRYILDGEVLGMEGGRALPFLRLQQRLGRLAPSPGVVAAHPVAFVAFDCLAHEETGLLDAPHPDPSGGAGGAGAAGRPAARPGVDRPERGGARGAVPRRAGAGQRGSHGQGAGLALRIGTPRGPVAQDQAPARDARRRRGGR